MSCLRWDLNPRHCTLDMHIRFVSEASIKAVFTIYSKQVYIEKKHPYDCFTNLNEDKSILMTAMWCPAFLTLSSMKDNSLL